MTTSATLDLSPLLIPVATVAEICGISQRTVWAMSASGKMPGPVAIGSRRLWRFAEIQAWVQQGCPSSERGQ